MTRPFALALATTLIAACGAPPTDETGLAFREDAVVKSGAATLTAFDPLPTMIAAHAAAARTIKAPLAVRLDGKRIGPWDSMHKLPQPKRPVYQWVWTFQNKTGDSVLVSVGLHQKPAALPPGGQGYDALAKPIDFSQLAYRATDVAKAISAAFPVETGHVSDDLTLTGPRTPVAGTNSAQGWYSLVYEQGNDDVFYFVDGASGAASEQPID